jgi:hypothetical protein
MRYRVLDLPPKGTGAFCPVPTTNPVASSYGLVKRTAALGLLPVPIGARGWVPPISLDPKTQGSHCAPDIILPDQYIAYADNMGPSKDAGFGMAARRHNPLPVPSRQGILVPQVSFAPKRVGGRVSMAWPRAFQRFPTRTPGKGTNG